MCWLEEGWNILTKTVSVLTHDERPCRRRCAVGKQRSGRAGEGAKERTRAKASLAARRRVRVCVLALPPAPLGCQPGQATRLCCLASLLPLRRRPLTPRPSPYTHTPSPSPRRTALLPPIMSEYTVAKHSELLSRTDLAPSPPPADQTLTMSRTVMVSVSRGTSGPPTVPRQLAPWSQSQPSTLHSRSERIFHLSSMSQSPARHLVELCSTLTGE
jgi:hypothetical protein